MFFDRCRKLLQRYLLIAVLVGCFQEDLERLGLYDEVWVRQRFMRAFHPENTLIVRVEGSPGAGSIAVRPEPDCQWIEHF